LTPLKHFLRLKKLNSAPKLHKLMPEIRNVWFSSNSSNFGHDRMSPNYAEKQKKHVPKI
jgi:hypothetical protein